VPMEWACMQMMVMPHVHIRIACSANLSGLIKQLRPHAGVQAGRLELPALPQAVQLQQLPQGVLSEELCDLVKALLTLSEESSLRAPCCPSTVQMPAACIITSHCYADCCKHLL
jgi:hypothetical protein